MPRRGQNSRAADTEGTLWVVGADDHGPLSLGIASGTSPAIAAF
jgi:hypothetical protein